MSDKHPADMQQTPEPAGQKNQPPEGSEDHHRSAGEAVPPPALAVDVPNYNASALMAMKRSGIPLPSTLAELSEIWRRSIQFGSKLRGHSRFREMFPHGIEFDPIDKRYDGYLTGVPAIIKSFKNQHPHRPDQPTERGLLALLLEDTDEESQGKGTGQRLRNSCRSQMSKGFPSRDHSMLLVDHLYNSLHQWGLQRGLNVVLCLRIPIKGLGEYITFDSDSTDEDNTLFVWIAHDTVENYIGLKRKVLGRDGNIYLSELFNRDDPTLTHDDAHCNDIRQPSPFDDSALSQSSANDDNNHQGNSHSQTPPPSDRVRDIVRGCNMRDVLLFFEGTHKINEANSLSTAMKDEKLYLVLQYLRDSYNEVREQRQGVSKPVWERAEARYTMGELIDEISHGFSNGVGSKEETRCYIDIAKAYARVFSDDI